ncbi:MAG TPA: cyclopropane-fatty-acyl-phospholipid synthase family protein [Solirubrobacteraceae bacterium]|nr:cyclopropane-fatty-acyl-phospholipid synthase family protein [Solirubrobacteraceae bacterium]
MPLATTEPLRRELTSALPERHFRVRFWDGTELPPTSANSNGNGDGDGPTFTVRSPKAVAHIVRAPGELGLGRAYVAGELEVDDLDHVIDLIDDFQEPGIDRATRARLGIAAIRACGLTLPPRAPKGELRLRGHSHSKERDSKAVRHHYDVSNEFFALFLDESMTYSCAIFSRGAKTLEQAQYAKLDLVCKKLALKEGERVLDVGCGWGAFVIHAAREYGVKAVGITLSPPQAELARRRIAQAGLSDRVEVRVEDYRDLHGERYDAIASIGMVEHVGESQIDVYAQKLANLLGPNGRLLNHGIAHLPHGLGYHGDFTQRYVFPDGDPLHLSRMQLALERAGFVTEHVEEFGRDYYDTLSEWIKRLDANLERAEQLAGPERLRVWRLYLRSARNIFKTQFVSIYQTLARPRRA